MDIRNLYIEFISISQCFFICLNYGHPAVLEKKYAGHRSGTAENEYVTDWDSEREK